MKTTKTITPLIACSLLLFAFVHQTDVWKAPESAKAKKNPVAITEASMAIGAKLYVKECLSCHGKKGRGDGPKASDIEKPVTDLSIAKTQAQTDGELFWKISEGRKPMPANKKIFSEEQLWQLVNYIRSFDKTIVKSK
jgi:mono/diheme cytochrome c family protein